MSTVFIRGFLAILVIADAKTRKLWKFSTHGRHLSLNILRFSYHKCVQQEDLPYE